LSEGWLLRKNKELKVWQIFCSNKSSRSGFVKDQLLYVSLLETACKSFQKGRLKGQFHEIWGFLMDIHRQNIVSRSTTNIFKIFIYVVIELFHLKDPMSLMRKTYLFPVQIGMPLANSSKICRIY
jgi:hypothetical protein